MNKTEQAEQLILAAELLKTGHPFEFRDAGEWIRAITVTPDHAICERREIRPILATPPDGRPLHNPDNLTAEQVGLGYRLGLQEESANQPHEVWTDGEWREAFKGVLAFINYGGTYRLPLYVPWPEVKPDPYAELKAAHAAGKVIQEDFFLWHDVTGRDPNWSLAPWLLRIKPEPPPFQLPPPPPGMKWHREDGWKAEDLPQGYRPHVDGEKNQKGDEWKPIRNNASGHWAPVTTISGTGSSEFSDLYRTTRPLIFTHKGKQWTYHRPGDLMPCGEQEKVTVLYNDPVQEFAGVPCSAHCFAWLNPSGFTPIIGWRYAETTKQVELGPEDVIAKLKEAIAMLETLTNFKA